MGNSDSATQSVRDLRDGFQTPGYSRCDRCWTSWDKVEGHNTLYSSFEAMFALCELCWRELQTPERRMPFYRVVWEKWMFNSSRSNYSCMAWEEIEKAVLAEGTTGAQV